MPNCKNDPTRKYKGTEPSPKGLGYCAHSMKVGAVKKGKDGNKWIIKEMKNGNKRWVKVNIKEKIQKDLFKKLYKWWLKLSIGGLLVIYKNGKHKFVKSNKKTHPAKSKDLAKKWIELDENKEVVAIIWSGQSYETLHYFSNYLVYKTSKKELDNILKSKKLTDYLIKNYKKYFYKYINKTKKDYMFKGFQKL
jgi:hypothetical protein